MSYQHAYEQTQPGHVEVKDLPAAVVMEAKRPDKSYFSKGRDATPFMPLFRYIQSHDIPMTTPVEVDVDDNRMWFFAPPDTKTASSADLSGTGEVAVKEIPSRKVLSIGLRGRYSEGRFHSGLDQLKQWLQENPGWQITGKPYAVYWNSPMTPFFLKKSEVHLPIKQGS